MEVAQALSFHLMRWELEMPLEELRLPLKVENLSAQATSPSLLGRYSKRRKLDPEKISEERTDCVKRSRTRTLEHLRNPKERIGLKNVRQKS